MPTTTSSSTGLTARLRSRWQRHPILVTTGAAVSVVLAVVVLVWFQPQKLLIDQRVDETLPGLDRPTGVGDADEEPVPTDSSEVDRPRGGRAEATTDDTMAPGDRMAADDESTENAEAVEEASGTEAPASTAPVVIAEGQLGSRSHTTSGNLLVVELEDGSRVLRIEDLATDNGPDLNVYLSSAPADAPEHEFDDDFLDLGDLKGNLGSQNYEVPADVDLDHYSTVVIWCVRFSVAFGTGTVL